jgi:predicted TIM-barrel fold metal-dependent hydrolase
MPTRKIDQEDQAMDRLPLLFDVNAGFGCGARRTPDFPRAIDLLTHLDYLGVDRALTYHAAARDSDGPFFGNRLLLDEIRTTPGAGQRLVPAFVITPSDFYKEGAMAFYTEHLRSGRVKALRGFSFLPHLERMIEPLARYRPVLLFSFQDTGSQDAADAIVKLARRFKDIAFICTSVMWGHYSLLLDTLWKSPNILADISWMHVRDSIAFLVKQFGAKRLVFGTGPKAHYGAGLAALAHAGISAKDRELIAHGNLEQLLGLRPLRASLIKTRPAILKEKPLWNIFRAGRPVKDVTVMDAHAHLGPASAGWYTGDNMAVMNKNLLTHMDKTGVRHMVVSSTAALSTDPVAANRSLARDLSRYPGRFSGYLTCSPHYQTTLEPLLDRFFANRFFIGFKLHPDGWQVPVGDPGYKYVWEYANRHALPILLHTWDTPFNSPRLLAGIAKKYPRALFLLGHSGGGDKGRREAVDLALAHANVRLEFCGSFCSTIPWDDTIGRVGARRVLFGSDSFLHDLSWELGRLLSTPLPDKQLAPILGANMLKIIKESRRDH